jgi:hypothetical protein
MTTPAQKQRERSYLDEFRRVVSVPGIVEEGERPDFIVRGDATIGVEVVDLFHVPGSDPLGWQRQRPRGDRAIAQAHAIFERAGGRRFDYAIDLARLPAEASIGEIAAQIWGAANAAAQDGPGGIVSSLLLEPFPLVSWMHRSENEYEEPRWYAMAVHDTPPLDPAAVQAAVDGKGIKLARYRACDAHWLLLVVNFSNRAQNQALVWPAEAVLQRRGFDRVFVLKTAHSEVLEPASVP